MHRVLFLFAILTVACVTPAPKTDTNAVSAPVPIKVTDERALKLLKMTE